MLLLIIIPAGNSEPRTLTSISWPNLTTGSRACRARALALICTATGGPMRPPRSVCCRSLYNSWKLSTSSVRSSNFCWHKVFFKSSSIGRATLKSTPSTGVSRAPVSSAAWGVLPGAEAIQPRQNPAGPAALRHPAAWGRPGGGPARGRPGQPAHQPVAEIKQTPPGQRAGSAPNPGA